MSGAEQDAERARVLEELAEQAARAVVALLAEEDGRQAALEELAARQAAAVDRLNRQAR
jgi:hypothetical protein